MTSAIFVRLTPLTESQSVRTSQVTLGAAENIAVPVVFGLPALQIQCGVPCSMGPRAGILTEGAIALPVTLSGGALFAS